MNKIRKEFRLNEETVSKIAALKKDLKITSETDVVTQAINYMYRKLSENEDEQKRRNIELSEVFLKQFDKKYGISLTRCRIASTTAERNSMTILEIFNSFLSAYNVSDPKDFKSRREEPNGIVKAAEEYTEKRVQEYIEKRKQNKDFAAK